MSEENMILAKVKKVAKKCELFLGLVLKKIIWNPIVVGILMFTIGSRLYEGGILLSKGSTVMISGVCVTKEGLPRNDLAQDQIIITRITNDEVAGTLRKTRESITCKTDDVSMDPMAPVYKMFTFKTEEIPELKKVEAPVEVKVVDDFKKYENKTFLVSGLCKNNEGKNLPAFVERKISIANVRAIQDEPGEFLFFGIRDDSETVVCKSSEVTMSAVSVSSIADSDLSQIKEPLSYKGKKVLVTALCSPDFRIYKETNRKPEVNFYDLTNTPVEVVQETIKDDKVIEIAGIIADKDAMIGNVSVFTHRIICDSTKYPLNIKIPDSETIELDKK